MSAGHNNSLALKSDGTVVACGNNALGQTNVPADLKGVVAIAAGGEHNLALKSVEQSSHGEIIAKQMYRQT